VAHPGLRPVVEYEVERILNWRKNQEGKVEFLVKWVRLNNNNDSTWEEQKAFTGAKEVLSDFILEPENSELAHFLGWYHGISTVRKHTSSGRPQRRSRLKGGRPSRRSSRISAMRTDVGTANTEI